MLLLIVVAVVVVGGGGGDGSGVDIFRMKWNRNQQLFFHSFVHFLLFSFSFPLLLLQL